MKAGIFTTTIEKVVNLGVQDTRHFKLTFDPGVDFEFEAGQFLNLMYPTPEKVIKRPYSIASSPLNKGHVDLCWKRVDGGLVTNWLMTLKEGDKLQIQGPLGRFNLKRPLPRQVIFISTGTGIAPFRGMIDVLLKKKEPCEVWNIFGNRYEEDILYRDEFENLAKQYPNFHNVFTVSRPRSKDWKGETEYVQHMLKKHIKNANDGHIYICGLTNMITAVVESATAMGFTKEQIFYEKYD